MTVDVEGVVVQRARGAGALVIEKEEQLLVVAAGKVRNDDRTAEVPAKLIEAQFRLGLALLVAELAGLSDEEAQQRLNTELAQNETELTSYAEV